MTLLRNLKGLGLVLLLMGTAGMSRPAHAQTAEQGRALFLDAGCTVCHAYVATSGTPSAKQMRITFAGNPEKVLRAIATAPAHANDPGIKAASEKQLRQISDWIAAAKTESRPPSVSTGAAPERETAQQAAARLKAEAKAKQEAQALARQDEVEKKRLAAEAKLALKKESEQKAKQAAEERERRAMGEQVALKREADEKVKKAAELKATRDAEVQAAQKRETDDMARRVAEAKAKNDLESQARLKREADDSARFAEKDKAAREAQDKAARQKTADELVQREASLKARRDADEQAALKREADDRARREAELAKRDSEARARKEAEAAAVKAVPAPTLGSKPAGEPRKALKAPEKFRDEPCSPATIAPITSVDEARAKAIMERIDCTGCHAYVQKKTGPPFKAVFEKVKGNSECVITNLKNSKEHNEEGVTDEIKPSEFKVVADYLATRAK